MANLPNIGELTAHWQQSYDRAEVGEFSQFVYDQIYIAIMSNLPNIGGFATCRIIIGGLITVIQVRQAGIGRPWTELQD